jgi:exopolyphosphatase/guanosine-5'-triphosphate,3'-diphosphate pyrophosphatase
MEVEAGRPTRLGVVDIGSTTATLALYHSGPVGFIDRFSQIGESLHLTRALGPGRTFPRGAVERTVSALRTFAAAAREQGVSQVIGVATSAVREARNREELLAAIQAGSGIRVELLDGEEEARAAARSALDTLSFTDGLVVDLGGGSLQVARVSGRRVKEVASLPLGSARVSDAFLRTDPPAGAELTALRRHAEGHLRALPWIRGADGLVGIGGTIRALAKMERRARRWPIAHGHGFHLAEDDVLATIDSVSRMSLAVRAAVPGLASHRVGVIVGGAVVLAALLRVSGLSSVLVSTYGLREGLALPVLHGPGLVRDVRAAGLNGRFPDPSGRARKAGEDVGRAFDRLAGQAGLEPAHRTMLTGALRVAASGVDPEHLLAEPLQGFAQHEVLGMAALLGLVDSEVPSTLRALHAEAARNLARTQDPRRVRG